MEMTETVSSADGFQSVEVRSILDPSNFSEASEVAFPQVWRSSLTPAAVTG
jgi:hypothetical protein